MGHVVKGFDVVNFYDEEGNHCSAAKGETLEDVATPGKGQVERLEKLGAFGDPSEEPPELTDPAGNPANVQEGAGDDLDSMQKADLVARAEAVGIQDAESMKVGELRTKLRESAARGSEG